MKKYKEIIERMLENNSIENKIDVIRALLKNDCNNHKITESEYIELEKFLNEKMQELENKEKKTEFKEKREKFCKDIELKRLPILNVQPIYKGEFGKVAPSRDEEK